MTPQPSALAALQPCPFCGGPAETRPDEVGSGGQHVPPEWCGCRKCGFYFDGETTEDAEDRWNTRAAWPTQGDSQPRGKEYRYRCIADGRIGLWESWQGCMQADAHHTEVNGFQYEWRYLYTHPSPSTAAHKDEASCPTCGYTCEVECSQTPSTAALREALDMLRECVEGEFGLQAWVDTYPCDHTPKLIERARTLLAGDKCG